MFDLRSENKKQKITSTAAIKCYYGILEYGESFDVMRLFHFSAIRLPIYGLLRSTTITTTTTHHHSKCYWNIYHSNKHTRAHTLLHAYHSYIYNFIWARKETEAEHKAEREKERVCEWVAIAYVGYCYCCCCCCFTVTIGMFARRHMPRLSAARCSTECVCVCCWFYFIS